MDQLQALRLPSMAKFNAGFHQCNQSFQQECVGPSKASYELRMMKVNFSPWFLVAYSCLHCLASQLPKYLTADFHCEISHYFANPF